MLTASGGDFRSNGACLASTLAAVCAPKHPVVTDGAFTVPTLDNRCDCTAPSYRGTRQNLPPSLEVISQPTRSQTPEPSAVQRSVSQFQPLVVPWGQSRRDLANQRRPVIQYPLAPQAPAHACRAPNTCRLALRPAQFEVPRPQST